MLRQIGRLRPNVNSDVSYPENWQDDEFEAIAQEFDLLFYA